MTVPVHTIEIAQLEEHPHAMREVPSSIPTTAKYNVDVLNTKINTERGTGAIGLIVVGWVGSAIAF